MSVCIHELDPASCSVCSGRDREPPPDASESGPAFAARYPGKCSCCGERFAEGDRIRADGGGGYACGRCAP